ncbi:hypothetical protein OG897_29380 [Streptomyces sp. NBC_00237]|nr:hypothetical protein [Streptomyces sp. NBC_00237]MCX5205560.1 hypothetical protein [Streptomyces sp. NBC_00237]
MRVLARCLLAVTLVLAGGAALSAPGSGAGTADVVSLDSSWGDEYVPPVS